MNSTKSTEQVRADLIKADTALKSFRDAGYHLGDAVGELVDNPLDSGASRIHIDWTADEKPAGKKTKRFITGFAVGDNGSGIPENILASVLTVGFSTRYGQRNTIGRFGVGFKLASISQCRRIEVYSRPAYLSAVEEVTKDGTKTWSSKVENKDRRVFMTYMDLGEIERGEQTHYHVREVDAFPKEFAHLMENCDTGTLVVWHDLDRLNNEQSYGEKVDEKLKDLPYFLARAYRVYIDQGLEIFLNRDKTPLDPYDPTFQIDNPLADQLAAGEPMKGQFIDKGELEIDEQLVTWSVHLTPSVTRLKMMGGGVHGPQGDNQFSRLHIPDNTGKVSFLRRNREISYTVVPHLFPNGVDKPDRYIGIEVSFPPALDEYFQVRHIKRGAEPVEKLKAELKKVLKKPIIRARSEIRKLWKDTKEPPKTSEDTSGGRNASIEVVRSADMGLPSGLGGQTISANQEDEALRRAAVDVGITNEKDQNEFVEHARQKPILALDVEWPGKGLIDIEHLNRTVLVRINRRHPFIQDIYSPIRDAIANRLNGLDEVAILELLNNAAAGMDLLLFAYAKAENMSRNPDEDYGELREDWGKFAAVYLRRRDQVKVE